jgi:hypothetical protein
VRPEPLKLEARLRSREVLREAMDFNDMTVRELAMCCGRPSYRSTIGHLLTGARLSTSPQLAKRIEKCLRLDPGELFELKVTGDQPGPTDPKALTRGKRAA